VNFLELLEQDVLYGDVLPVTKSTAVKQ